MADERTQFDYLLNAFEHASQSDKPAENGYAAKRKALFAYVRSLEAVRSQDEALLRQAREALEMTRAGLEWYRDGQTENVNGSDEEADEVIESALSALNGSSASDRTPG